MGSFFKRNTLYTSNTSLKIQLKIQILNQLRPPTRPSRMYQSECRFWLNEPDEIVENVLLCALQQSGISFPEHSFVTFIDLSHGLKLF